MTKLGDIPVLLLVALTLSLAGCPVRTPHQGWAYGGRNSDWGHSVQATQDGGFVVAGITSSYGARQSEAYLFRTDAAGKELWRRTYGGPRDDEAKSVQALEDGGFVVAGQYVWSMAEGREDAYLVRTDSQGRKLWSKTYGGADWDSASTVLALDDGFVVAGLTASFGVQGTDGYVVRTDANGDEVWSKTYGGADEEFFFAAQALEDGGFVFAGTTTSFGAGDFDAYLVRTDAAGNEIWSKTYGDDDKDSASASSRGVFDDRVIARSLRRSNLAFPSAIRRRVKEIASSKTPRNDAVALSVQVVPGGGFLLAGWTQSYGAAGVDAYLVRADADGNELWRKTYGGPNDDMFSSVQALEGGEYVAAGRYERDTDAGSDDAWLLRADADGNEIWSKTYGGSADEEAQSLLALPDGRFVLAGWTDSFGHGAWDAYLVLTDSNGNQLNWPNGRSVLARLTATPFGSRMYANRKSYAPENELGVPPISRELAAVTDGVRRLCKGHWDNWHN